MEKFAIDIANEFNKRLGGRWINIGPFSGEQFYIEILKKRFQEAFSAGEKLHVYLDGTKGYGSSFLDQSFGELGREFGVEKVKETIVFHTKLFFWHVEYINREIWV